MFRLPRYLGVHRMLWLQVVPCASTLLNAPAEVGGQIHLGPSQSPRFRNILVGSAPGFANTRSMAGDR